MVMDSIEKDNFYNNRKYSKEELIEAWKSSANIHQCIIKLNLRVSSNTYTSVKNALIHENLIEDNKDHTYTKRRNIKRRIIKSGGINHLECNTCNIETWNGKELKLHLDHINGNNDDNRLENLRFLCPNCHSQTETFGKIKKIKSKKKCKLCKDYLPRNNTTKLCQGCLIIEKIDIDYVHDWEKSKFTLEEFIAAWNENNTLTGLAERLNISRSKTKKRHNLLSIGYNLNLDIERYIEHAKNKTRKSRTKEEFIVEFLKENGTTRQTTIRNGILKFKLIPYKCSDCDIEDSYNNKPLTLHLEHKNGNRTDHRIDNLTFLCPNCHSQTKTYCGKNKI